MNRSFFKARISYLLIGLLTIPVFFEASAAEINCDSAVWKKKKQCLDEDGGVKKKSIIDPDTGMTVIELESDINWNLSLIHI